MSLFLSRILSAVAVLDTVFEAITFLAAEPVHGTPESDGGSGLIFFKMSPGTWTQPVSPIVPAASLEDP